jgi:hypothetical protein
MLHLAAVKSGLTPAAEGARSVSARAVMQTADWMVLTGITVVTDLPHLPEVLAAIAARGFVLRRANWRLL